MGNRSYYKYKQKKSNEWNKTFDKIYCDIKENISFGRNNGVRQNNCCRPPIVGNIAARMCIYVLIGLTLLFSGIGFYSLIILGMLVLILSFLNC